MDEQPRDTSAPRQTPLYEAHRRLGAKIIDFGGWSMPVSYPAGILEEHRATRTAVGVFDVSHMGELHVTGPRATEAVQRLVTNDVGKLRDGQALYTVACNDRGGVVDDLIVYRRADTHYLIVVNATTTAKDEAWFRARLAPTAGVELRNASDETALIAFQGPKAEAALQPLTPASLSTLRSFHFASDVEVAGVNVTIARTGYTGEDGFELFCRSENAPALWDALIEAARQAGGGAVGLGARDTLRLEARLPLYGNELDEDTTPLEAGLGWVVKLEAGPFVGRDALRAQHAAGVTRRLVGMVMRGRGIPRHGYAIYDDAETESRLGTVTSGGVGPTVAENVALGYVPAARAQVGTSPPPGPVFIDCRGKRVPAELVSGPFYKRQKREQST